MRDFVSRFHLRAHSISAIRAALLVIALALACAPGCKRVAHESATKANDPATPRMASALALVPPDAEIVLSLDLERLRGQSALTTVLSGLTKSPRPILDDFAVATGFDWNRQLRRVLVALPGERQSDDRFLVIADVEQLDEARVTAWLQARLGEKIAVFVRGKNQIVISQGAWADTMAALSRASTLMRSAADRPELLRLCARAAADHSLWFAAIVPAAVRHRLMQQPSLADVAALARVSGFMNSGGQAEGVAELSSSADAAALAHRLGFYLNLAKRHPEMLVRGLAPYLEALRLTAHDARVHATLDIPGDQVGDLIERIEALAHAPWTK